MSVNRIYVEKAPGFTIEADQLREDLCSNLGIRGLEHVRVLNRYDVQGLTPEELEAAKPVIFYEPQSDLVMDQPDIPAGARSFLSEYLPGQFDQRADSCAQCIQLLTMGPRPLVRTAKLYILEGRLSDGEFERIKQYLINPVESREADAAPVETLETDYEIPTTVETLEGFIELDTAGLEQFLRQYGLAMDLDDIRFCQAYFRDQERRDPTITEVRMIDTYWSDHCRHTTFLTNLEHVEIAPGYINEAFSDYLNARAEVYTKKLKPMTLMDIATMGAKLLKKRGCLKNMDESEEINACSIHITANVDGEDQDWLLMFKNETHNHPTEIEPFGGAATCLGGAIRDPLSGRSYVYQAMRVTGAADPTVPLEKTMKGKLPQRKIVTTAAAGYSSYGNQIGLATGIVDELYHPGYAAKRLEIGAVVGAVKADSVVREVPQPDDIVILLGGRTGRDGCGGATGSSKSHTSDSLKTCGAEVQKGNPPEERKLQRLFRNPEVTRMIKRCNDFGAGGVSVAIGELADGLAIDLSAVPRKYDGLDGTELAISESQERMAVVVAPQDVQRFIEKAAEENLEATVVARVMAEPRLRMTWNGVEIVNISREFLNSNGASKHTDVTIPAPSLDGLYRRISCGGFEETLLRLLSDLNVCSKQGLAERFDSTIGAATVVMPFGGAYQATPSQYMAAKLPVAGETDTCSVMAYGFDPYLCEKSPYHGAVASVVESVARLAASGADWRQAYLTFQEYFERTKNDPSRWGKPMAALLGAFNAQLGLGLAAIGGKDSMSGTFENLDVPPTLVSFAIAPFNASRVVTSELKEGGHTVCFLRPRYNENQLPDYESVKTLFDWIHTLTASGRAVSVWACGYGGIAEGIAKMSLGNRVGFAFDQALPVEALFEECPGSFLVELAAPLDTPPADITCQVVGVTDESGQLSYGDERVPLKRVVEVYTRPLEQIFPTVSPVEGQAECFSCTTRPQILPQGLGRPKILIPVFPGTNTEYDAVRSFERAGGDARAFVIQNRTSQQITQSALAFEQALRESNILMLPGGFSGGDEPDGSGKFIATFLRNPRIMDAVHELLQKRDGLILGICNGFQALVKLGLLPFGEIVPMTPDCPTLTFNRIGRHQSMMVRTRIASVNSPWMTHVSVGDIHTVAVSHGEGRFVASPQLLEKLQAGGQIATQYVDLSGQPTYDSRFNPNGSVQAIEGVLSPDGRILGKMGHSERSGADLYRNIPGNKEQPIFLSGVEYFK